MRDICLILDGFALAYRAYFSMPTTLKTKKGPINAALGFYNCLAKLMEQVRPTYLVVAWDTKTPTFRHQWFPAYKAQRPPMPEDLSLQMPLIRQILQSCQIPVLELPGYEADDIIGTITRCLPEKTEAYIVTTDRDALQLVKEDVTVLIPNPKANRIYTPTTVRLEWQIPPSLVPDLKALMGDSSDNIPGVPFVGPKTATKWLVEFETLEGVLAHAHSLPGKAGESLRNHQEEALFYRTLTTIDCNVPLLFCWKQFSLCKDFKELKKTLLDIGILASLPQTG